MKTFAFRTEGFDDGKRVPALLAKLGVSKYVNEEICDPGNENWKMDKFIVEVEDSVELETFRTRMAELVDVNKEFENMHRCHETLAEGEVPREQWYCHDNNPTGNDLLPSEDEIAQESIARNRKEGSAIVDLRRLSGEIAYTTAEGTTLYANAWEAYKDTGVSINNIMAQLRYHHEGNERPDPEGEGTEGFHFPEKY